MKSISLIQAEWMTDRWNEWVPIGSAVEFHPVIGEPECRERTTRTEASVFPSDVAVVWLNGESGCVTLLACMPIKGTSRPQPDRKGTEGPESIVTEATNG